MADMGSVLKELSSLESKHLGRLKKERQATRDKLLKMREDYENQLKDLDLDFQKKRKEALEKAAQDSEAEAKKYFAEYDKKGNLSHPIEKVDRD